MPDIIQHSFCRCLPEASHLSPNNKTRCLRISLSFPEPTALCRSNILGKFYCSNFFTSALGKPSNTTLRILSVKGGGSTPQIRNPLFAEKKSVKGGRGVPPKSVTYFLDQNQVFLSKKLNFWPFFKEKFSGKFP